MTKVQDLQAFKEIGMYRDGVFEQKRKNERGEFFLCGLEGS